MTVQTLRLNYEPFVGFPRGDTGLCNAMTHANDSDSWRT